jgi:hypothetical protein
MLRQRRNRQGRIFKTWHHKRTGVSIVIRIDQDGFFTAQYGDRVIGNEKLPELEKELKQFVEESEKLEWIQVLKANVTGQRFHGDGESIGLNIDRFWLAEKRDGTWIKAPWDSEEERDLSDQYSQSRMDRSSAFYTADNTPSFSIPYIADGEGGTCYYRYSDAMWLGLTAISERIAALRAKLGEMIKTESGMKQIAGLKPNLLPAGEPERNPDPLPLGTLRIGSRKGKKK